VSLVALCFFLVLASELPVFAAKLLLIAPAVPEFLLQFALELSALALQWC
jgi:hypothetical protein